jgi:uncharacterized membrane protein YkgB
MLTGYWKLKAGIAGDIVASVMFLATSSMLITTPGATTLMHGVRHISFIGLFRFKDIMSLGVAFYPICYFGPKAILSENKINELK